MLQCEKVVIVSTVGVEWWVELSTSLQSGENGFFGDHRDDWRMIILRVIDLFALFCSESRLNCARLWKDHYCNILLLVLEMRFLESVRGHLSLVVSLTEWL